MSNPYKRLKLLYSSWRMNNDSNSSEQNDIKSNSTSEDVYKFQPFKLCLEYKTDIKKAVKYPNNFPMPRSGHRIVCNSRYIISYGGYNPRSVGSNNRVQSNELYKEIWKFDCVHKKWRLLDVANTPPYAASNCCTLIGNNILTIFGGTSFPFGEESGNDLYVLDMTEEEKFTIVTGDQAERGAEGEAGEEEAAAQEERGSKPPGRYGQAVVVNENYLYSIGGTTGFVYSMDVHRLCLTTHRWSTLYNSDLFGPGDPEPRYRHEAVYFQGHIYVLGGGTEARVFSLEDIHSFDTSSRVWATSHTSPDPLSLSYPAPRKCHGLVQAASTPSTLFILGGVGGGDVLDDVWRLDLLRLQWTRLPLRLPNKVYFHATTVSPQDKVYMFGGITCTTSGPDDDSSSGSNETSATERTADLYSTYLTIPRLREICLEAVKYYYKKHTFDQTG
uniref:Kelch domain-containing protein 10 homolog n=1 Tax=Cacopsylla melanoneura TaxID=428564 RepID=A0A8D8W8E5_9HEMI